MKLGTNFLGQAKAARETDAQVATLERAHVASLPIDNDENMPVANIPTQVAFPVSLPVQQVQNHCPAPIPNDPESYNQMVQARKAAFCGQALAAAMNNMQW